MKRKSSIILLFIIFMFLFSGCSDSISNQSYVSSEDIKSNTINILELNGEEQRIFNDYISSPSDEILVGLEPLTICKFYFLIAEKKDYKILYNLMDENDTALLSKAEFISESEKSDEFEFIEKLRNNVINTDVFELENGEAVVQIDFDDGDRIQFKLIKYSDNIWKIKCMPIQ